jgi:anti-sigma B factor antagonist
VETVIGVFSSRGSAENAVLELLEQQVPPEEIVFLTRCGGEGESVLKRWGTTFGGVVGFATGMSAGVGAAILMMVPGVGQVAALGIGAAALLGLAGMGAGSMLGKGAAEAAAAPDPHAEKVSEDVNFFREVLAEGRSLVVVRTETTETAKVANEILNRLGVSIPEQAPVRLQITTRHVGDVTIVDMTGRITLGEGSKALREMMRSMADQGYQKILLNLQGVGYIDSSGLGELVKAYTTVRGHGGHLKLVQVNKRVHDLLEITKLHLVLEIEPDEATALKGFETDGTGESKG